MSALNLVLSSFLPSMPPSSAFQWFLLVGPAVVVLAYFVTIFPHTPNELYIHPSLATLDKSTPSWSIYPDNYYEGGAYVKFPQGSVSPVCSTFIAFISTNHGLIGSLLARWSGEWEAGMFFRSSFVDPF